MRARAGVVVPVLAWLMIAACDHPSSPSVTTGLTGTVVRGPVTPVCQIQTPCDAPFSATFTVEQSSRRITQFQSDAQGRFTVMLPSGVYRIVPAADAPIISPQSQVKDVQVLPAGLTEVRLEFDTGIR